MTIGCLSHLFKRLSLQVTIATDGSNLKAVWSFGEGVIKLDNIYSNDIAEILRTYGVEAARSAIIKEMSGVFGVYGIAVNYRHLTIIADYMVSPSHGLSVKCQGQDVLTPHSRRERLARAVTKPSTGRESPRVPRRSSNRRTRRRRTSLPTPHSMVISMTAVHLPPESSLVGRPRAEPAFSMSVWKCHRAKRSYHELALLLACASVSPSHSSSLVMCLNDRRINAIHSCRTSGNYSHW